MLFFWFQGVLATEDVKSNLLLMSEDITIGLTLLSLRYEGLRMSDYEAGQKHPRMKRPIFQRIGCSWALFAAGFAAFASSLRRQGMDHPFFGNLCKRRCWTCWSPIWSQNRELLQSGRQPCFSSAGWKARCKHRLKRWEEMAF